MAEVLESDLDYEAATSPFKKAEVAEELQDNVEGEDQVEEANEVKPKDNVELEGKLRDESESEEKTEGVKGIEEEEGELEDGEISEEGEVASSGRKRGREEREERKVCRHFQAGRCSWGKVTSLPLLKVLLWI